MLLKSPLIRYKNQTEIEILGDSCVSVTSKSRGATPFGFGRWTVCSSMFFYEKIILSYAFNE